MAVAAVNGRLDVTVTVTNSGAGHHVPTDHPGRHLLLVVSAVDGGGQPLTQLAGPTIPDWGGSFAGLPGVGFAKVLQDVATAEAPVISYWKQALIESDNRIAALEADVSTYAFQARRQPGHRDGQDLLQAAFRAHRRSLWLGSGRGADGGAGRYGGPWPVRRALEARVMACGGVWSSLEEGRPGGVQKGIPILRRC